MWKWFDRRYAQAPSVTLANSEMQSGNSEGETKPKQQEEEIMGLSNAKALHN
jgi:hypothetical protein